MTLELDSYAAQYGPNDMQAEGEADTPALAPQNTAELCRRALSLARTLVTLLEHPQAKQESGQAASELSIAASLASHVVEILKTLPSST